MTGAEWPRHIERLPFRVLKSLKIAWIKRRAVLARSCPRYQIRGYVLYLCCQLVHSKLFIRCNHDNHSHIKDTALGKQFQSPPTLPLTLSIEWENLELHYMQESWQLCYSLMSEKLGPYWKRQEVVLSVSIDCNLVYQSSAWHWCLEIYSGHRIKNRGSNTKWQPWTWFSLRLLWSHV